MASWNDFYGPNYNFYNQVPQWMPLGMGPVSSQVMPLPPDHQSNYGVFSDPYTPSSGPHVTTMVLKVPICCEGCEEKVKSRLIDIDGVEGVSVDQLQHKVTVSGTAPPEEILNACKKLFKRSKWWPS